MFKVKPKTSRKKVHRTRQRWNWYYPLYAAGCFAAFIFSLWFYLSFDHLMKDTQKWALRKSQDMGFVLRDIAVEGRERTPEETILAIVNLKRNDPVWAFDPHAVKDSLEKSTWVESALVQRHLPDTIYIKLQERVPLALWQYQNSHFVIDSKGKVIEGESPQKYNNLILVVGKEAGTQAPHVMESIQQFPGLMERITAMTHQHGDRWDVRLDNKVDVKLPEEKIEVALQKLRELEQDHDLSKGEIMSIDLRFPDKLILRLKPEVARRNAVKGRDA